MDILTGTYVVINKADGQSTADITNGIAKLKIGLHLIINRHNELLINVPATGFGCSLSELRTAVSPAGVRVFDSRINDIQAEERTYYDV